MSSVTAVPCLFCQANALTRGVDESGELHWLECENCGATGPTGKSKLEAVKLYEAASPAVVTNETAEESLLRKLEPAIWNMLVIGYDLDEARYARRMRNEDFKYQTLDVEVDPEELPHLARALMDELQGEHDQRDAEELAEDTPEEESDDENP